MVSDETLFRNRRSLSFCLAGAFCAGRSGSARLSPGFSVVPTLISLNVQLRDTAQAFDASFCYSPKCPQNAKPRALALKFAPPT
jgi:hypothetical protein